MKIDENTIQTPSKKRLTFTEKTGQNVVNICDCLEEIYYLCFGDQCVGDCKTCEHAEICEYHLKSKIMNIFNKLEVK